MKSGGAIFFFFFKFNHTSGMEAIGGVLVHTGHTGNRYGVCVRGVAAVVLFALSAAPPRGSEFSV